MRNQRQTRRQEKSPCVWGGGSVALWVTGCGMGWYQGKSSQGDGPEMGSVRGDNGLFWWRQLRWGSSLNPGFGWAEVGAGGRAGKACSNKRVENGMPLSSNKKHRTFSECPPGQRRGSKYVLAKKASKVT